jgi:uncharacterized protein YfaS (alpha-2-macroglobulin family)
LYYNAPTLSDIEYIFGFRNSYIWKNAGDTLQAEIIFQDAGRNFDNEKLFQLSVIAVKNDQCAGLNAEISKTFSRGYSFIQTDKPIYKPSDEVKVRVLVLDKNLRPYKKSLFLNEVVLEFLDPEGNNFEAIKVKSYDGLYEFKFPLGDNAVLGDWQITSKVANRTYLSVSKFISVQKYVLPIFDVTIETNPTAYFTESKISFKIFAKYSFGEYAKGKAILKIINTKTMAILYSEEIDHVQNIINKEIDFVSHLKIEKSKSNVKLNVTVDFLDKQSQTSRTKTEQIQVFPEKTMNLEIYSGNIFKAGKPFHIDVLLKYPSGELVNGKDIVTLDMSYLDSSKHEKHFINNKVLKHGIASFQFQIPENLSRATIIAKYLHFETRKDVSVDSEIESGYFNIILPDEK